MLDHGGEKPLPVVSFGRINGLCQQRQRRHIRLIPRNLGFGSHQLPFKLSYFTGHSLRIGSPLLSHQESRADLNLLQLLRNTGLLSLERTNPPLQLCDESFIRHRFAHSRQLAQGPVCGLPHTLRLALQARNLALTYVGCGKLAVQVHKSRLTARDQIPLPPDG